MKTRSCAKWAMAVLGLTLLGVAANAHATGLKANEELGDGILTGTNSLGIMENIQANAVTGNLFWWADTNGDNTANDPASAGLNLGAYNLTRQSDYSVGFHAEPERRHPGPRHHVAGSCRRKDYHAAGHQRPAGRSDYDPRSYGYNL